MHVAVDLNWFLQFIGLAFAIVFGLLYLVRNTASRYFLVDSSFDSSAADYSLDRSKRETMAASGDAADFFDLCVVCRRLTKKHCAGCKTVRYCCGACQTSHWDEHKTKCKELLLVHKANNTKSTYALRGKKGFVPRVGNSRILKQSNEILFPYDDFLELFNWNKKGYTPCGLINCGNSCFANAVLQCLTYTRPLVAYLLEKGHRIECQRDDWCFFCEFETHVERCSQSRNPFSPINILSRLPNIGGNLGYGKQEDAHEFMRFAIDNMQSACLDRYGGEKAVHPSCQETTLIQHIFGGRLQSQVKCTQCHNISSQFENMMDLTVEIHGDAESLEECLDQFTAEEQLHGDNMYKCDSCNAYVKAWKRLSIRRAPNILTVALKRFQTGRFGKLNKRVTFPDTLDLADYMSELEDGNDIYKLYAVIVHVDMLNASFFGHYICYIKDFSGNWYRIDDCKVSSVDLDEVLSQGAYMVLYSRVFASPSCLRPAEPIKKEKNNTIRNEPAECLSTAEWLDNCVDPGRLSSASELTLSSDEELLFTVGGAEDQREGIRVVSSELDLPFDKDAKPHNEGFSIAPEQVTSPVNNSNERCHEMTVQSDIKESPANNSNETCYEITVQSDIKEDELSSPMVIDGDSFWGTQTYANEDLFKYLEAETHSDERCTVEQGNNNASVDDILTSISENAKSSLDELQDAAKESDVKSPVEKLKPLFTPGFLGKRPGKKYSKTLNEGSVDLSSPMLVDVDSSYRSQTDAEKDLFNNLVEKSHPDERCTVKQGITPENSSVVALWCDDSQDASAGKIRAEKLKPLFTPGFLGKRPVKEYVNPVSAPMHIDGYSSLGNQIDGNFRNSAEESHSDESNGTTESGKSDRESPIGKLKPIFAPGFLGKRPLKKCTREKSVDCYMVSPKRYLKQRNEVGFLKDEEKTCDVHANGNGSMELCMSKSVTNGDSCDQNGFCEGTLKVTTCPGGLAFGKGFVGNEAGAIH